MKRRSFIATCIAALCVPISTISSNKPSNESTQAKLIKYTTISSGHMFQFKSMEVMKTGDIAYLNKCGQIVPYGENPFGYVVSTQDNFINVALATFEV